MSYRINLFRVVDALSSGLDLVGIDDLFHGKRVGLMALRVAEELSWPRARRESLLHAALLHDCGVSTTTEHEHLATEFEYGNAQEHCRVGSDLMRGVHLLRDLAPIVRYHHTRWDEMARHWIPSSIAEMANLIFLVDRLDVLRAALGGADEAAHREMLLAPLTDAGGTLFHPVLVEALRRATEKEGFWADLRPASLHARLTERAAAFATTEKEIGFDELKSLTLMFAHIIDAKSHFTAEHSIKVAETASYIAAEIGLEPAVCDGIEIAGLLHDLGKLRVPDAILDKPGPLTDTEWRVMRHHAEDTQDILFQLFGNTAITQWAALHHETLLGDGYPSRCPAERIPLEARIVAIADILQALVQDRPYRDGLYPDQVMTILDDMAGAGRIDRRITGFVRAHLLPCWAVAGGCHERLCAA
ncbi:MAG: HD domain-containing protein [Alphaproteobacteria bacterium]|nr:HD domain-containing protein [Alphaproteobacteria bacterium]